MFLLGHIEQTLNDLPRGYTLKIKALAARKDSGQHFMHIRRSQDEDNIVGRFLQRLEQGIKGLGSEHVGFVQHIDFVFASGGRHHDLLAQVTDIVDTTIGGRVNLNHVERVARCNLTTLLAFVAWFAVFRIAAIDCFGKQTGSTGFAGTSRTGKEIGMRYIVVFQGIFERANNRLLTNKIIKSL